MKYFSTRGGQSGLSFEETVLTGLGSDGGLFIPESIPSLPQDWASSWADLSFQQLSVQVLSLFISPEEISHDELTTLVTNSYKTFRHPEITPLHQLSPEKYILELFHGPTYAFKDVALQLLGNLFEFFLLRRNAKKSADEPAEKLTVVGATSGDTGSAAIYGLRNKAHISIFILHPKGRVSPIQEAQMTTVTDENVHNLAVQGTFDDCQDIVKTLFGDKEFNAKHHLGAVNSINWARILAQTVYYFLAYFHLQKQVGYNVVPQFVVPTGNFGDILAGYYAKRMGLPISSLAVATNENDILYRFWKTGKYEKAEGGVKETYSPAMDIMISSNFERLLWYLAFGTAGSGEDSEEARRQKACAALSGWMKSVKADGRAEVPIAALEQAREDFVAERVSDPEILETIKQYYVNYKYIVDPHTAVGLTASGRLAEAGKCQVVLSTAHPAKFSEAVTKALGSAGELNFERDVLPEEFRDLLQRERRVINIKNVDVEEVKAAIESKL
ncbi:tryptophan synthase beta subunit-like PLP-dependent enzyme [Flagelloscypha sp. PMI_526]|nr:tryptophan synthase beta subunit-like PLP-dependent enzyme [Flagelloscypha sp. PMI_526]